MIRAWLRNLSAIERRALIENLSITFGLTAWLVLCLTGATP